MRRKFLAAAVALLAAVSIASCSSGSDSSTLMVGTEGTYSPFSFQGSDGKLTGYDVEVVQAVGAKLGKNVEFVETPGIRSSPRSRPTASTWSPTR